MCFGRDNTARNRTKGRHPLQIRSFIGKESGLINQKSTEIPSGAGVLECRNVSFEYQPGCSGGLSQELTKEFSQTGTELSGGEAQKLAVARAFYKRAGIALLFFYINI